MVLPSNPSSDTLLSWVLTFGGKPFLIDRVPVMDFMDLTGAVPGLHLVVESGTI